MACTSRQTTKTINPLFKDHLLTAIGLVPLLETS